VAPSERPLPVRPARGAAWVERALAALLVLALLWGLLLHQIAPSLVRDAIVDALSELTGRPASVDRVEIDPWLLQVRVHRLAVGGLAEPAAVDPRTHARVGLIEIDIGWSSLWHLAAVVQQLRIVEPRITVVRDAAGRWDGADILERRAARPAPTGASGPLPRFVLWQTSIDAGHVGLVDRSRGVEHHARAIRVDMPMLSSLPGDRSTGVEARLSLVLDDAAVGLVAGARPFADDPAARLELTLDGYELKRLWPWLPEPHPVRLTSGRLSTRAALTASRPVDEPMRVVARADARVDALGLRQPDDRPLLELQDLRLDAIEVEPLQRRLAIGTVTLVEPRAALGRSPGERRFIEPVLAAIDSAAARRPAGGDPVGDRAGSWRWAVGNIVIDSARLEIDDAAFEPRALRLGLHPVNLGIRGLSSQPEVPIEATVTALADGGERLEGQARVSREPLQVESQLRLQAVPLARWAWLVGPSLGLQIDDGRLAAAARLRLAGGAQGALTWQIDDGVLGLESLALRDDRREVVRAAAIDVGPIIVEPQQRRLALGELQLAGARIGLRRLADGSVDAVRWWRSPDAQSPAAPVDVDPAAPWQVALDRFWLDQARLSLEHEAIDDQPAAAALVIESLTLEALDLANAGARPARFEASARLADGGQLALQGTALVPARTLDLSLKANGIDLPLAQPWLPESLDVELTSGRLSADGKLHLKAGGSGPGGKPAGRWQGSLSVDDLEVRLSDSALAAAAPGAAADEDRRRLIGWRSMRVSDLGVDLEPLFVDAGRIELDRLRVRLAVGADGRLNLRAAAGPVPQPQAAGDTATRRGTTMRSGPAPGGVDDPVTLTPRADDGPTMDETPGRSAAVELPAGRVGALPVRIGSLALTRGHVDFSDELIRPRFSVELTGLDGEVGELRAGQPGVVSLEGRIDNTGAVRIEGRVDPFAEALFVDLRAEARDIDLPVLTPYSAKYIGYGIEKGKLSARLDYKVEQRRLEAQHEIVLDQLTLGESVDSPDALKLPVTLALALLKDRNGVIDVRLPIGGSLDDPQFSVGGIVIRIISNLIVKAVTAPFSLLAGLVGGAEAELSTLAFAPGESTLGPVTRERLERLSKGLADRPGLRLDITGRATLADADALRKAAEDARQKAGREVSPKPGVAAAAAQAAPAPPEVSEGQLRELANRRAQLAKDWLSGEGGIAASRLFITAPSIAQPPGDAEAPGVALLLK
jgi:uncharacterized protein involved in outer membrane biogenesis